MRILKEHDDENLLNLRETFDPGDTPTKLGKHNAAAIVDALASAATAPFIAPPTLHELRSSVAAALEGKALPYPANITPRSYEEKIIGGMRCYILSAERSESVPT